MALTASLAFRELQQEATNALTLEHRSNSYVVDVEPVIRHFEDEGTDNFRLRYGYMHLEPFDHLCIVFEYRPRLLADSLDVVNVRLADARRNARSVLRPGWSR